MAGDNKLKYPYSMKEYGNNQLKFELSSRLPDSDLTLKETPGNILDPLSSPRSEKTPRQEEDLL